MHFTHANICTIVTKRFLAKWSHFFCTCKLVHNTKQCKNANKFLPFGFYEVLSEVFLPYCPHKVACSLLVNVSSAPRTLHYVGHLLLLVAIYSQMHVYTVH